MTKARNLSKLASVNTSIVGNTVYISGNVSLANATLSFGANTINSTSLTSTGVVANSYGNTTAIPVITVDAAGRITNATTSSVSGVTGLSFTPANSTITVSTSTTNFDAAVTSGNSTVQGLLKVIDSVSNTSTLIAGSANSVTTAYLLAANAVSNATAAYSNAVSYADTKAGTAYSNATSYADTVASTAYSNAVSVAASDATSKAGTAYSNAIATSASDATTKAGTAYSNATSYADTKAGTAYSNAVSVAASDATTKAGTAYTNATSYADTKAGTAYSNATSYADTKAGTAYSNATSYADTKAAAAYSNVFNGGTFSGAVVVQANLTANSVRMNGDLQIDGNLTVSGNSVTINVTNLNVEDNMIYLNSNSTVSHPDLGFAGNYNDGSYKHAGLFRDATDGVWKFFHGYTPEPDASVYIDTSNASFTFSNLQINYVIGNVTGSANSATYLGGNTAATLRSYSDTMAGTAYSNATTYAATIAGTAYSNATTYAATIAGTAYSNAVSVAASDATTKAGTAYSNATTYAATIAGTAYSNAIAFAANASNISSGTLSASRLPATYLTAESDTLATVTARGSTTSGAMTISSGTTDQGLTMTVSDAGWNYIGFSHGATRKAYFGLDGSGNPQWGSDSGAFSITGNYTTIGTSARSPLFYDSDDTTYYTDPGGVSVLKSLSISTYTAPSVFTYPGILSIGNIGYNYLFTNGTWTSSVTVGLLANCADQWEMAIHDSGTRVVSPFAFYGGGSNYIIMGRDIGWGTTYIQAAESFRAPIFYDSGDTAYWIDPNASQSANFAGHVWIGSTSFANPGGWNKTLTLDGTNHARIRLKASAYGSYGANETYMWLDNTATPNSGIVAPNVFYLNASYTQMANSARAPIFYDLDDTGYYIDPNSTSNTALRMRGGALFGPNPSWGAYLYVGTNGNIDSGTATVAATNGNLHLDAANGYVMYLNNYATSSYTIAAQNIRSPLFYDSNDTGYYCDPNGTSELSGLSNGTKVRAGLNIHYYNRQAATSDTNYWTGAMGWYTTYDWNSIFYSLGSGFIDQWSVGGHPQGTVHAQGFQAMHYRNGSTGYGWQMTCQDGNGSNRLWTRKIWGSSPMGWNELAIYGINVGGTLYPNIIYDSDNTGYYSDPNSTSRMGTINADLLRSYYNVYIDGNYGYSVVGLYSSYIFQGVFAMGDSYKLSAGGGVNNLYGMCWSHPNAGGAAGNLDSHGLIILINGGYGSSMSYSIKASGNVTAYSDERLKTNWRDMPEDFVARLAKVKVGIYDRVDGEKLAQVGVSAQSLQTLLPQAVTEANDDIKTLSVSYGNAAMASAVELAKEVVLLKQTISSQEERIAKLEALVNNLLMR